MVFISECRIHQKGTCEENFKVIQLYTGESNREDCFSNETVINSAGDCCDFNV